MVNQEFSVDGRPPINFTLKVIATDLPVKDRNFKAKIVFDFVPAFTPELRADTPYFHGNKIYNLLRFISDRVIKKVIEFVYYDRANEAFCKENGIEIPLGYRNAIAIYNKRQEIKAKCEPGDLSYLDHREEEAEYNDRNSIETLINTLFDSADRPVWDKEANVTRVTFEELSPSTLSVESRTVVNGDKRPK